MAMTVKNYTEQYNQIRDLLFKQLSNYWDDFDTSIIEKSIPKAIELVESGLSTNSKSDHIDNDFKKTLFMPYRSVHWMIFLYRLSRQIYIDSCGESPIEADYVYYLNKIMHSNDWFYTVDLPIHFLCEHPLGSVLGKAKYGDYLFVYQGTTVGGNRNKGTLYYPELGENVILFANSSILGNSHIGNNVVISANSMVINQDVPDNCVVFGQSPDIVIKEKDEEQIKEYTQHIWKWK